MTARGPDYQKERGERQINRLLFACSIAPQSAKAIAAALNIDLSGISTYTAKLMASPRRLYIADYQRSVRGRPAPLYMAGDLPDAEFVRSRKTRLTVDRVTKRIEMIVAALTTPMTGKQLAKQVHLSTPRAVFYLSMLRAEKKVYIAGWEHPGGRGDLAPIYALGNRRDAKKPVQTRKARYKAEMKDEARRERIQALRKANTNIAAAVRVQSTWLSALGVV